MKRHQITFLIAGFIAGSITAAAGSVSLWVLTVGAGPLFFLGIIAAIALTDIWPHVPAGFWRYVLAACTSTMAYVLALLTFWWLGGYLQSLLGGGGSNDLGEFRLDMWIGLIGAAVVAAACVELMAYILTNTWSNAVLARLACAGILAIVLTFVVVRAVRTTKTLPSLLYYWSFFGTLFAFGEAFLSGLVGTQIWKTSRVAAPTN